MGLCLELLLSLAFFKAAEEDCNIVQAAQNGCNSDGNNLHVGKEVDALGGVVAALVHDGEEDDGVDSPDPHLNIDTIGNILSTLQGIHSLRIYCFPKPTPFIWNAGANCFKPTQSNNDLHEVV